eukprot:6164562-Lingulodinium_polyedra.AAC.1
MHFVSEQTGLENAPPTQRQTYWTVQCAQQMAHIIALLMSRTNNACATCMHIGPPFWGTQRAATTLH